MQHPKRSWDRIGSPGRVVSTNRPPEALASPHPAEPSIAASGRPGSHWPSDPLLSSQAPRHLNAEPLCHRRIHVRCVSAEPLRGLAVVRRDSQPEQQRSRSVGGRSGVMVSVPPSLRSHDSFAGRDGRPVSTNRPPRPSRPPARHPYGGIGHRTFQNRSSRPASPSCRARESGHVVSLRPARTRTSSRLPP
jgi:hypothetical protein